MNGSIALTGDDALIIVDVQNDFCTGSLAIPDALSIVPVLNRLAPLFEHSVATQDWHPPGHVSFASSHAGTAPGGVVEASYGPQPVFADHCVRGTWGAELRQDLDTSNAALVLRKGMNRDIDSFSAFVENDETTATGLAGWLSDRGVRRVFLAGLALYGCVRHSALDARKAGFEVFIVDDASRSRPDPEHERICSRELADAGVIRINSGNIPPPV